MNQTVSRKLPVGVKRLKHVTLIVKNLERSRHFYCDILGMEQMERLVFDFAGMWFRLENVELHLVLQYDRSAEAGYPNETPQTGEGLVHHIAFEVDSAFAAAEQLKEQGVRMAGGPPGRRPDFAQLWCYDPDGHVVELFGGPREISS